MSFSSIFCQGTTSDSGLSLFCSGAAADGPRAPPNTRTEMSAGEKKKKKTDEEVEGFDEELTIQAFWKERQETGGGEIGFIYVHHHQNHYYHPRVRVGPESEDGFENPRISPHFTNYSMLTQFLG